MSRRGKVAKEVISTCLEWIRGTEPIAPRPTFVDDAHARKVYPGLFDEGPKPVDVMTPGRQSFFRRSVSPLGQRNIPKPSPHVQTPSKVPSTVDTGDVVTPQRMGEVEVVVSELQAMMKHFVSRQESFLEAMNSAAVISGEKGAESVVLSMDPLPSTTPSPPVVKSSPQSPGLVSNGESAGVTVSPFAPTGGLPTPMDLADPRAVQAATSGALTGYQFSNQPYPSHLARSSATVGMPNYQPPEVPPPLLRTFDDYLITQSITPLGARKASVNPVTSVGGPFMSKLFSHGSYQSVSEWVRGRRLRGFRNKIEAELLAETVDALILEAGGGDPRYFIGTRFFELMIRRIEALIWSDAAGNLKSAKTIVEAHLSPVLSDHTFTDDSNYAATMAKAKMLNSSGASALYGDDEEETPPPSARVKQQQQTEQAKKDRAAQAARDKAAAAAKASE